MPETDDTFPVPSAFHKFAEIDVFIDEDLAEDEIPQIVFETAALIESALTNHFRGDTSLNSMSYRFVTLPDLYLRGSLLISIGVFIGTAIVPTWLFLRDYEKVRSGFISFTDDMQNIMKSVAPSSNRIPAERIEPVVAYVAPAAHDVLDQKPLPRNTAWESTDKTIRNRIPRTGVGK
ncbi:MAG: hypothetical protein RJQ07_04460 [Pseudomonadales bacterium]